MGFCSNQWLRGYGESYRADEPRLVAIEAAKAIDWWSEEHKVVVQITARQSNSERIELRLTRADVDKCADEIFSACSVKVRERFALKVLKEMAATKLVESLTTILKLRLRDEHPRK